jgi:prohibitin 1
MVNLPLGLLSRPNVSCLPTIFTSLGTEYDAKVLPSIGNEVLKAMVSQVVLLLNFVHGWIEKWVA